MKLLFGFLFIFKVNCLSRVVKNISDLPPPSASEGNIYKKCRDYVLDGTEHDIFLFDTALEASSVDATKDFNQYQL